MASPQLAKLLARSQSRAIALRQRDAKTGETFWVVYRLRRVGSLSDALTQAALILAASALVGFGLAMGWAWARGGF
jgi:hypothetical protein